MRHTSTQQPTPTQPSLYPEGEIFPYIDHLALPAAAAPPSSASLADCKANKRKKQELCKQEEMNCNFITNNPTVTCAINDTNTYNNNL